MCSAIEEVQCESGTSSVQAIMCSLSPVQVRVCSTSKYIIKFWDTALEYFPMNELLLVLIYQVKMASTLWQVAKIN